MASPPGSPAPQSLSLSEQGRQRNWRALVDQLFRYAFNCGIVLVFKLALAWLLLLVLLPAIAYFLVHIGTFFVSYAIHARVTFGVAYSRAHVRQYFSAVIGFKVLDYLVFTVLFAALQIDALLSVFLASLAVMLLRFAVVRRILKPATTTPAGGNACTNN